MKRLLFMVGFLSTFLFCFSQIKISSPHPDLVIEFRRCIMSGSRVTVDFMLINKGQKEFKDLRIEIGGGSATNQSVAFDDLGSKYIVNTGSVGGEEVKRINTGNSLRLLLPEEIGLKCRIVIDDVDPNATELKKLSLSMRWNFKGDIVFTNLPIQKD
ncbi:MAG: hypothetical protein ACRC3Z_10310 [Phocaeicola sp.]